MNRRDESANMRAGKRPSVRYYGLSFAAALLLVGGGAIAGLTGSETTAPPPSRISPALQEIIDRPLPPAPLHYFIWYDEGDLEMVREANEVAELAEANLDRPVQIHRITLDQQELASSMMNDLLETGQSFQTIDLRR